jgi:hypothetical protein
MKKINTILVYIILSLLSVLAIRGWYGFFIEFISEDGIVNGVSAMVFTAISVAGWILRKEIIEEVIK